MTDMFRKLRVALVTLVNGDSTLRTLMGRNELLIASWSSLTSDGPFPIIAYSLDAFAQTGADNDTRRGRLLLSVIGHGTTALETVESIAERLEALVRSDTLLAIDPTVDAAPVIITRRYPDPADGDERGVERTDVDMELEITQAA